MKKQIFGFLCFSWICIFYSCTDPILDNPFEEYIPPDLSITNSVPDGSEITISWVADNQFALEFSYILEPDDTEWSSWSSNTIAYYNHLNEGDYLFKVKSRYEEEFEQETPDSVTFTINNIVGPGLRFFPLYMEVENSEAFTMEIYAEEVTGLVGAEIGCNYDPNMVLLDTTAISAGYFLLATSGQTILIKEFDLVTGYVLLTLATVLDEGTGLTASGSLVQLPFTAVSSGILEFSFSTASVYVQNASPNTPVSFSTLTSAMVIIE